MRFSELAHGFTKYMVQHRNSPRGTGETYDRGFDQFTAYLVSSGAGNDVKAFTAENIAGFTAWAAENGNGANSIRRQLSALSSLAKFAMKPAAMARVGLKMKPLVGNPVDGVERPQFIEPTKRWLALDELYAIIDQPAPARDKLALACVVDQPLRASEWCNADVGDLVLKGDRVVLTVRVKGGGLVEKKLGLKLTEALTASLREREAKPDEPLLLNSLGKRYTRQGFSETINRLAHKARIPGDVRAHAIRRTVADIAAQKGAREFEIADLLNHRSLQTARVYVRRVSSDAALDRVREAIHNTPR
jgi:integrase